MEDEVKVPKKRLKKTEPVVDTQADPEQEKWNRAVLKEAKRNREMEAAFEKMAAYVAENVNSDVLDVEFCVDEKARVVVCRVEYPAAECDDCNCGCVELGDVKYGISRCAEGDRWNPLLGQYLALKRAKGTKIPESIMTAIGHVY